MPRRNAAKKPKPKSIAETLAELGADMMENQAPRADAVFAPISFEDEDDLPRQTLPMLVVRRWFQ
jgi:signal recognition particle subunit SEC65